MVRARRASGGREGDLLDRASRLRKGVDDLLPELTRDCPKDRFDRLREALEEVRGDKDDRDRLLRRARAWGGEDLAKAYAGLLAFYLEPEMPPLLVASMPGGDIAYAPLSKASREAEIAVQQSDEARRLMLGYLPWARKGFHFFAVGHRLYCSGPSDVPPEEVRSAKLRELPYRTVGSADGREQQCSHVAEGGGGLALRVAWPGADRTIRICRRCAKDDRHLLGYLTEGVAAPDPAAAFPTSVDLGVRCADGDRCLHQRLPGPSRRLQQQYLFGRIGDASFLDEYRKEIQPTLDRASPPIWVAGGRCFGTDRSAFVAALDPTPEERQALEEVLPDVRGCFEISEPSASRALERLWPTYADRIVHSIVPDAGRAEALVREARANPGRVSDLLGRAARETREREVLGALPTLVELAPEAQFVDGIGRAYRAGGGSAAEKAILARMPREGKQRGLAWGVLLALARSEPHRWQFTDTERQFGESLKPLAREFLDAPPAEYVRTLGAILGAAGVAAWGRVG